MSHLAEKTVPLDALSARQQRLVQRHLPLVHLTLSRMDISTRPFRSGREKCDLVQEGCLALADAVRSHDPLEHGRFAPFAMARVRYAISRYRHEREGLIRVPFTTQRRRLARSRDQRGDDRHRTEPTSRRPRSGAVPVPKVVPRGDLSCGHIRHIRRNADNLAPTQSGDSIADRIRERYDRALARALDAMKHAPGGNGPARDLLARFHDERWTIPEPEAKTPLRKLARELNRSLGTVTRCEERVRRKVAALLRRDRVYRDLRRMARTKSAAWDHRLTPADLAELQSSPKSAPSNP